jgi:uncharacterized membrane protein YbhN (UPF0104 family)
LVAGADYSLWACGLWLAFLLSPLAVFPFRDPVLAAARRKLPDRFKKLINEVDDGIPRSLATFIRAWALTVLNWGVKVLVLAWVLALMRVEPIAACFGGALGGELSSVLPVHAPAGVGTYPAGIAAGAAAFGADRAAGAAAILAKASINAHLLVIVSALVGTGISLVLPVLAGLGRPENRKRRDD